MKKFSSSQKLVKTAQTYKKVKIFKKLKIQKFLLYILQGEINE